MIIEGIRKDDHIVDENLTIIVVNSQYPVYKMLYIKRRIHKSYKDHLRTFHLSLTNKSESIAMIKVYG